MGSDLKQYYEEYLQLFSEPGWKHFIADMQRFFDGADKVSGLKDVDGLKFRLGELSTLSHVINWQNAVATSYEELLSTDEAENAA